MARRTNPSKFWHAAELGGADLLHAEASHHAFARHMHEGYAFGVVEAGGHGFAARGEGWRAAPGDVLVVNPEDVHDGGPVGPEGYSYRMIYASPTVFAALDDESGRPTPLFRRLVVRDTALGRRLWRLHRVLERAPERLARESHFLAALSALAGQHATDRAEPAPLAANAPAVARARAYLEAHLAEDVSLPELARVAGVSRFHLLRQFRREFGLPPHAWHMQLRLLRAQRLLRAGETPAGVAASLGFADQSHLTRRFLAAFGVTPGQYLQSNRVQ